MTADRAAETDVSGRCIDRLALARRRPEAQAVVGGAQVRAPLDGATGYVAAGLATDEALMGVSTSRVMRGATGAPTAGGMTSGEVVLRPFPHVPRHVRSAEHT